MVVGRIFSRERPIVDFPGVAKRILQEVVKVAKFYCNHSKLRKQPFLIKKLIRKSQISKSMVGPRSLLPHFRRPCTGCSSSSQYRKTGVCGGLVTFAVFLGVIYEKQSTYIYSELHWRNWRGEGVQAKCKNRAPLHLYFGFSNLSVFNKLLFFWVFCCDLGCLYRHPHPDSLLFLKICFCVLAIGHPTAANGPPSAKFPPWLRLLVTSLLNWSRVLEVLASPSLRFRDFLKRDKRQLKTSSPEWETCAQSRLAWRALLCCLLCYLTLTAKKLRLLNDEYLKYRNTLWHN